MERANSNPRKPARSSQDGPSTVPTPQQPLETEVSRAMPFQQSRHSNKGRKTLSKAAKAAKVASRENRRVIEESLMNSISDLDVDGDLLDSERETPSRTKSAESPSLAQHLARAPPRRSKSSSSSVRSGSSTRKEIRRKLKTSPLVQMQTSLDGAKTRKSLDEQLTQQPQSRKQRSASVSGEERSPIRRQTRSSSASVASAASTSSNKSGNSRSSSKSRKERSSKRRGTRPKDVTPVTQPPSSIEQELGDLPFESDVADSTGPLSPVPLDTPTNGRPPRSPTDGQVVKAVPPPSILTNSTPLAEENPAEDTPDQGKGGKKREGKRSPFPGFPRLKKSISLGSKKGASVAVAALKKAGALSGKYPVKKPIRDDVTVGATTVSTASTASTDFSDLSDDYSVESANAEARRVSTVKTFSVLLSRLRTDGDVPEMEHGTPQGDVIVRRVPPRAMSAPLTPVGKKRNKAATASEKAARSVGFGTVTIREYERCVGDNPAVTSGAPIQLGWGYARYKDVDVDLYESKIRKQGPRSRKDFFLTPQQRFHILLDEWDYTIQEICRAKDQASEVRYQRQVSIFGEAAVHQAMQAAQTATASQAPPPPPPLPKNRAPIPGTFQRKRTGKLPRKTRSETPFPPNSRSQAVSVGINQ